MKNIITIVAALAAFVCLASPDDVATEAYAHYEATNECAKTSASLTSLVVDYYNQAKGYAESKCATALASAKEYANGLLVTAKDYADDKVAAVKAYFEAKGYLTPVATNNLAKVSYVDAKTEGMATTAWVEGLGYVTTATMLGMGYTSTNDVMAILNPYATKTYVAGLGYLTEDEMKAWVNGQVFAKESWVSDQMSVMNGEIHQWVLDHDYSSKDWVREYHASHGGGGGGGGVDTNAVIDIIHETVSGSARSLPKYLHYLPFDDTYPADAQAFYDSVGGARVMGGCSIVRKGNLVGGNFDYPYDDACSFAIKVSAGKGANADGSDRHASVGAAYLGTLLTENIVSSGVSTPLYRVLPGMTESGINDAGVYAKINVIPRDESKDPAQSSTRNIHALGVVRYVLDHFDNAADAAQYIAAHYYIPEGSADSYHWMIADVNGSHIVEDGAVVRSGSLSLSALFNLRIGISDDPYGSGYSRMDVVAERSLDPIPEILEALKFTNAYADGWPWPDEFAGMTDSQGKIPHDATDRLRAWANEHVAPLLDANRKPAARGNGCWQTVHSVIYDFEKKTMAICVQEDFSKRYIFAVDQANVDLSPIEAQIAALQDGKRDRDDLIVYTNGWSRFVWSSDDPTAPEGWVEAANAQADNQPYVYANPDFPLDRYWVTPVIADCGLAVPSYSGMDAAVLHFEFSAYNPSYYTFSATATRRVVPVESDDRIATENGVDEAIAEHHDSTKRDTTDNTCHKTEFTEWSFSGDITLGKTYSIYSFVSGEDVFTFQLLEDGVRILEDCIDYPEFPVELEFASMPGEDPFRLITATRSPVCTDGKKFVTDDIVDGKVSSAVSTNNPAFVSAVRNTPTSGMPEDMPSDWGTYGTVGAALAALAAFVKWAKAKIVAVIGDDGKPTDTFATDLLGKQVAKEAVNNLIDAKIVPANSDLEDALNGTEEN